MLLDNSIEFYTTFTVLEGGHYEETGDYAPTVCHVPEHDVIVDSSEWEPLTGYTGQYGYNGAVLHESEYLGGGLLEDILADVGGTYVLVPVEDLDDSELVGWTVLRKLK